MDSLENASVDLGKGVTEETAVQQNQVCVCGGGVSM